MAPKKDISGQTYPALPLKSPSQIHRLGIEEYLCIARKVNQILGLLTYTFRENAFILGALQTNKRLLKRVKLPKIRYLEIF